MSKILEVIGALLDAIVGPSTTCTYLGTMKHVTEKVRTTVNGNHLDVGVSSIRTVYRTHYSRWWIPDATLVVFEVVGHVPDASRHLIDPRLLIPTVFPLLCNPLLKWTSYPHYYAINAYVDRVRPAAVPYQVSL